MICLHGFMDNGLCYDRVAEQFLPSHNLYLIDARGHGLSSDTPPNTTYLDLVTDIRDVCDHHKLSGVIVVGHSMGGAMAGLFAATYPEYVKGVVLEDPGFTGKRTKFFRGLSAFFFSMFVRHRETPDSVEHSEKRAKRLNRKWADRDNIVWAKAQREFFLHYPAEDLKVLFTGASAKEILPKITVPILLVTAQSGIVTRIQAKQWQKLAPRLEWVHVLKSGHNIRREQFDTYIKAIQQFLKK